MIALPPVGVSKVGWRARLPSFVVERKLLAEGKKEKPPPLGDSFLLALSLHPDGEIFRPVDGRPTTAHRVYVEEV